MINKHKIKNTWTTGTNPRGLSNKFTKILVINQINKCSLDSRNIESRWFKFSPPNIR